MFASLNRYWIGRIFRGLTLIPDGLNKTLNQRCTITVNRFTLPEFDKATERLFWQERHQASLRTLKASLAIGIFGFAGFMLIDIQRRQLTTYDLLLHGLLITGLFGMLLSLSIRPLAQYTIKRIAQSAIALALLNVLGSFWLMQNPDYYAETWASLLPIYFFAYGQLFLSLGEASLLGWITALLVPLSGYWVGASLTALLSSLFVLMIVNLFGHCTRWQLENYSRHSFLERRTALCLAEDKNLFLRQISHNLRQPLQALSCYVSTLESIHQKDTLNKASDPILQRLGLAIDELNNAFEHIFCIANLESGKQLPSLQSVDLNQLFNSLEDQFAPLAAKRGIALHIRLRKRPPFHGYSDPCILHQILANLLDNAIKYTPSGWILLEAIRMNEQQLKLRVIDTGVGIAQQQQTEVFKEFYRGQRRSTDEPLTGLGIGLAYVQKAVQQLPNHSLQLQSKPNQGTHFVLRLPIAALSQPPIETADDTWASQLTGKLIWLLDDDVAVTNALAESLIAWGCKVERLANLAALTELITDNLYAPDLLISDYPLYQHNRIFEVIAHIEQHFEALPFLILSNQTVPPQIKQQLPENVALLRKPASAKKLQQAMLQAMDFDEPSVTTANFVAASPL